MVRSREVEGDGQGMTRDVCFVDFDWAGRAGVATLPPFARSFLRHFPSGSILTQQYDLDLLKLDP